MAIPYLLSETSITVVIDGAPQAIPNSHSAFTQIVEMINEPFTTVEDLRPLLNIGKAIETFTSGMISVANRVLQFDGLELNTSLTRKIIEYMNEGKEEMIPPLAAFLTRVMNNPSSRAVDGLFDWVSKSGMPITNDGLIMAWKIVGPDFMDYYSGTLDHTPGNVVSQPRNRCDEDPDQTCSAGIHFCSFNYLPSYRNDADRRVLLVQIDPADVVAIPREYNTAKGRCCKLTVLQEVPKEKIEHFFDDPIIEIAPEFEFGQVWATRAGDRVMIVDVDDAHNPDKPIRGDDNLTRTNNGMWSEYEDEDEDDLVEYISG